MFTIDLLKGQAIPARSGPEALAVVAAGFAVPVVIVLVMIGYYLHSRIIISVEKQRIASYEKKMEELSDVVALQKLFEREKGFANGCLADVSSSIGRYVQWSPLLIELVKSMPDSMVLTRLEVKRSSVKKQLAKKDDPGKTVDFVVPVRMLQIKVEGNPQSDCDKTVRDFRDKLKSSASLGPMLEDIKIAQSFSTASGREVVSYEIDCTLKSKLPADLR